MGNKERSTVGRSYQRIANVPARANSSTTENTYTYTDAAQTTGTMYYRLKMVDRSGTYKYSTIVLINRAENKPATYRISPNPVKGNVLNLITSLTDQQDAYVRIIDASGRVWHKEMIPATVLNSGKVGIVTTSLPSGIYYLQVRNNKTGAVQLLKFKKE